MTPSHEQIIQSLLQSSSKKPHNLRPCNDLVKNEQEAINFMNDMSYNHYDILEQLKELDSTGKKTNYCFAEERC